MSMSILGADYKQATNTSWVSGLSFQDHQRLRKAVRRVHMKHLPAALYTDKQADMLIEALGPQTGERLIKALVDGKIK